MKYGRIKILAVCFILLVLCACGKDTAEEDLFSDHYVASAIACTENFTGVRDIRTIEGEVYLLSSTSDNTLCTLCVYAPESRVLTTLGELPDGIQEAHLGANTVITIQGNYIVEYDYMLKEISSTYVQKTPQHIAIYNDIVYVASDNIIYSLPEGTEVVCLDNPVETMYRTSNGIVITWWENSCRMAGVLDPSGTLLQSLEIGQMALIFSDDTTYHPQNSDIYTFDWTSGEDIPEFNLSDCNIESTNIKAIEKICDKQYFLVFTQPMVSRLQFAIVEVTSDEETQLKTITIGTIASSVEDVDSLIIKDIEQFNAKNLGIKAEVVLYADEAELQLSLVSGEGPDIFDLNVIDRDTYAAVGALADLLPWIEKDSDLDQADFVQSWLNVMITNGHLYGLYPAILVRTLVANRDAVTGEYGWSLQDFQNTIEFLPEDTSVIQGRSALDILGMILSYSMDDFVDYENYVCDFCTEDFYKILDMSLASDDADCQSASALLTYWSLPYSLNSSIGMDMFKSQDDAFPESSFAKIGFPGADGNGSVFYTGPNYYGMNANSLSQSEVWTFMKFLLSSEKQGSMQFGFPVLQDEFNTLLENIQQPYISSNDAGESVEMNGLTSEQAENLRTLINGITEFGGTTNTNAVIIEIIFEEADAFFAGEKDTVQTADLIDNRVRIYLAEQQ